jgi:hypothetical protein
LHKKKSKKIGRYGKIPLVFLFNLWYNKTVVNPIFQIHKKVGKIYHDIYYIHFAQPFHCPVGRLAAFPFGKEGSASRC